MVVKVVVLDDDPIFMELIKTVLALEPTIAVIGDAATMEEGIAVALRECPDVILVDYRLPDGTGTMAAQFIRLRDNGGEHCSFNGMAKVRSESQRLPSGWCCLESSERVASMSGRTTDYSSATGRRSSY
jgi:CheY-like chemotaxis protein